MELFHFSKVKNTNLIPLRPLSYEDPLYYVKDTLGRNDTEKPPGSFSVQAKTPKAEKLRITFRCSSDPDSHRIWQISNPNPEPVTYDWNIKDSDQEGTEVAPPGDSYLETDAEPGANVLQLTVEGKKQDNLAGKLDRCAPGQEPTADTSRWWNLGSRPVPVPADWQSEQGQNLVLKLGNQGVTDFTMRWVKTPQHLIALPAGISEIGQAGGIVELPGVAKLEIPVGALSTKKTIALTQVLNAPSRSKPPHSSSEQVAENESLIGTSYISPLVRIEPFGLILNKPALLTLPGANETELQNRFPGGHIFEIMRTLDLSENSFYSSTWSLRTISNIYHTSLDIRNPIPLDQFGYVAKLVKNGFNISNATPNTGFHTNSLSNSACESIFPDYAPYNIQVFGKSSAVSNKFEMVISTKISENHITESDICKMMAAFEKSSYRIETAKTNDESNEDQGLKLHDKYNDRNFKPVIFIDDSYGGASGKFNLHCPNGVTDPRIKVPDRCEHSFEMAYCADFSGNPAPNPCILNENIFFLTASHEALHRYQAGYVLNNASDLSTDNDKWLREGSADWFASFFIDEEAEFLHIDYDPQLNLAGLHAALYTKDAINNPLSSYKGISAYAYSGLFLTIERHTQDKISIWKAIKNYQTSRTQDSNTLKSLHNLDEALKIKNYNLQDLYSIYAKNALLMNNIKITDVMKNPLKNNKVALEHVDVIKPQFPEQMLSKSNTSNNPLTFSVEVDNTQTKYFQISALSNELDPHTKIVIRYTGISTPNINNFNTLEYVIPFELFNATILGIRSSERDYEPQYSNRHPRKRRGAQTIAQTAA